LRGGRAFPAIRKKRPVGTLRSRLFRARRMLFVELHDYAKKTGIIRRLKD